MLILFFFNNYILSLINFLNVFPLNVELTVDVVLLMFELHKLSKLLKTLHQNVDILSLFKNPVITAGELTVISGL